MFTWEKDFQPTREDGRYLTTLAAEFSRLRNLKPEFSYNADFQKEDVELWRKKVKAKLVELMQFPVFTKQPAPVMIWKAQRDGYRVERWEFYPEDYNVVPVLILIPDGVSAKNPAPGMLCFPGSNTCKELLAGEEHGLHPNYNDSRFPERNKMAQHYVKAGLIAVAFDHLGIGELAEQGIFDKETQWGTRVKLCGDLLCAGRNYLGMSVFQKICFLKWFKQQKYLDSSRIGVCGHSLGSETAMVLGVLEEDVKAVVFNDFLCDNRRREIAVTNFDDATLSSNNWHIVPGFWQWFGFQDLLASMAPKALLINEGGAAEFLNVVQDAYTKMNANEKLKINYYPKYTKPESRKDRNCSIPLKDLSSNEFYEYSCIDVGDHSFRPQYSIPWIKKIFGMDSD